MKFINKFILATAFLLGSLGNGFADGPGQDFVIAVLPDTQNYAREESGYGNATRQMWYAQTDWIVANRASQNVVYVATLGDCVHNAGNHGQWRIATNAYYRIEKQSTTGLLHGVPYGVTVGNHDQSPAGDENGDTTYYNQYFGTAHFNGKPYYGGHFGANNDNWYTLFSGGGLDFIVFSFEFGRYGSVILDWAENVLAQYPNRRVIVLTHHAGADNSNVNATTTSFSAQGSAIYNRLKTNPNFFLMLGGHVFSNGGEGRRSDTFNGKTVHTLISNYQNRWNGGNGLMRLLRFSPSQNKVFVTTYSPYTGTYETDANSQFSFNYDMRKTVTVDNSNSGFSVAGTWSTGTTAVDKYGSDYRFRSTQPISEPATWSGGLVGSGNYTVQAWWSQGPNRSATAPYIVYHSAGSTSINVNQQINGGKWNALGTFNLNSGANQVKLSCWTTTGFVVLGDAVRWVP
ncbi:MAG: hypothetical protein H0X66_16450 [Verrucomicrobia bacterium]|nr:hypothetical protein [Verrucomicrobiota bacterium]